MTATKTIQTEAGALELVPATVDELRDVARAWPMEIVGNGAEPDLFGLVFQKGDEEVHGLKMQPPDVEASQATVVHHVNRALIAKALPFYLEKGHRGVMVPCAYHRKKGPDRVETGIAMFVGPHASSAPSAGDPSDTLYDAKLGAGATAMIFDMVAALAKAREATGLPLFTVIGMDVRPRLALGGLAMHFVVSGSRVVVVKYPLDEKEPIWRYVVEAGFSRLPYAAMQPAALPGQMPPTVRRI